MPVTSRQEFVVSFVPVQAREGRGTVVPMATTYGHDVGSLLWIEREVCWAYRVTSSRPALNAAWCIEAFADEGPSDISELPADELSTMSPALVLAELGGFGCTDAFDVMYSDGTRGIVRTL